MKEFLKALFEVSLIQLIYWVTIVLFNEVLFKDDFVSLLVSLILSVILIILYFINQAKLKKKEEINLWKYNICYVIIFLVFSVFFTFGILKLTDYEILNGSGGIFSGLEYLEFGYILIVDLVIVIIIKFIIFIFKLLKRSDRKC